MNIFLGGPTNFDWRDEITSAASQSFTPITEKKDYPFAYLWRQWIKGGRSQVPLSTCLDTKVADYSGPFFVGKDVPAAYFPSPLTQTQALAYSMRIANIAYFWVPSNGIYRDEVLSQIGYAIATKERAKRYYKIAISFDNWVSSAGWFIQNQVDYFKENKNAVDGFYKAMEELTSDGL